MNRMNNQSVSGSRSSQDGASSRDASRPMADSMSKSLTGGGKGNFETPGAQQDFQKGMRSAIADMFEGGQTGNKEQVTKGITALLDLITGLNKAKGGDSDDACKGGKNANRPEAAGPTAPTAPTAPAAPTAPSAASGSSAPSGVSSGDDKKKKMEELIQMLLAMGVSPEMISQLLESIGMSSSESEQLLNQAQQTAASGSQGSEPLGNPSSQAKNAIPA